MSTRQKVKKIREGGIVLARQGKAECVIVVPPKSKLCSLAAIRLQTFIEKACGNRPRIRKQNSLHIRAKQQTVIAIGTAVDFNDLETFHLKAELDKVKCDGYILKSIFHKGKDYILALGRIESGAVNAVWPLMRKILIDKKSVSVGSLNMVKSPFLKGREVITFAPWLRDDFSVFGGAAPLSDTRIVEKYFPQNWPETRLRTYVDLISSFGYNSQQWGDPWFFSVFILYPGRDPLELEKLNKENGWQEVRQDYLDKRKAWREKLITIADQCHCNGMEISLIYLASCVKDWDTGKYVMHPCWNNNVGRPNDRELLLKEYDYIADSYGPHIDAISTQWRDYGGCSVKEKIQTACLKDACPLCQENPTDGEQQKVIMEKLHKYNPKIKGYINWFLPDKARKDMPDDTGRSNWDWHLTDKEGYEGMYVFTKHIEKTLRKISSAQAEVLEIYAVPVLSQFLVYHNLYVAGQLMWDPQQSAAKALREYTQGMFGHKNGEKIASVLEAYEKTLFPGEKGREYSGGWPEHRKLDYIVKSHEDSMNEALKQIKYLKKAREILVSVRIDPDFVSPFPVTIDPQELLREMDVQCQARYARVAIVPAALELLDKKRNGESSENLLKGIKAIPKVSGSPDEYILNLQLKGHRRYGDTKDYFRICWEDLYKKLGLAGNPRSAYDKWMIGQE